MDRISDERLYYLLICNIAVTFLFSFSDVPSAIHRCETAYPESNCAELQKSGTSLFVNGCSFKITSNFLASLLFKQGHK